MQTEREKTLKATLDKDGNVEVDFSNASQLYDKGFGEVRGSKLSLSPYEVLYLVDEGKLSVESEEGKLLSFDELLNEFTERSPSFWINYVVYRDLRRKGYVVKQGFGGGLSFRVYEKGRKDYAKYLVYPFFEGKTVKASELLEVAKQSIAKDKALIVAVVERRGEVIYYQCSATIPAE